MKSEEPGGMKGDDPRGRLQGQGQMIAIPIQLLIFIIYLFICLLPSNLLEG